MLLHPRPNLIVGRFGIFVEQSDRTHDHSRGAVAALECSKVGECLLDWVEVVSRRQAFDGQNRPAVALEAEHEAGEHRLSVEQHRAGAAFSELAPVFGA